MGNFQIDRKIKMLAVFQTKIHYYKNGIFWFQKALNRAIGEERYENLRMSRRIYQAKMYYQRQQLLFEMFLDFPEWANSLGVYPKQDSSHGFPWQQPYEMFRDWQENTINTDGWFGMWIAVWSALYIVHTTYSYIIPYYWASTPNKNSQEIRLRMRDAIGSTVAEELYGVQWMEMAYTPHDFANQRARGSSGYSQPDDPRAMHMSTFNRKHRYREHYIKKVGENQGRMVGADY
eukprot:TRINITY_DN1160_c0_g1_i5.p1 TRINITY_DN1160_c0_g1~~TRINITY_DN1160_c0_g1_i5.p1  ORF type:complete len:233 (+),score=30.11 TRINITY_DN1160_c0_g1_i5:148-846(+)